MQTVARRRAACTGHGRESRGTDMTARSRPLIVVVGGLLAGAISVAACSTTGSSVGASASGSSTSAPTAGARPSTSGSTSAPAPPADLDAGPRASCSANLPPGWVERENAQAGVSVAVPPTDTAANLYLDTVSATCGQRVHAAVSAPAGTYRLRVLRVGWYGGAGGRVV